MSKALTLAECQKQFLQRLDASVKSVMDDLMPRPINDAVEIEHKIRLVVFDILTILDGEDAELPLFNLMPESHPNDEAYARQHDRDWWPDDIDLADGTLHDQWAKRNFR